jgi:phosphatidylserine/phosphatidylglycerophosphate/cardiolipin synthase-like enzyme
VLCGSTNFTHNGVYRQANVVHTALRPELAQKYLELFEVLFGGATPGDTKKWINVNNPLSSDAPIVAGFSPRGGEVDLDLFAAEIRGAAGDVLFCTAFDLNDRILEALKGKPHDEILRFGLQNSRDEITGIHRDRTADFVAVAMLNQGLEGFLKESTAGQSGNILIHTKLVVIDFTSDAPTVISGSHNLSANASGANDENFLIIRGAVDVADCYGVELMRLYDHYRFRWHQSPRSHEGEEPAPVPPPEDPTWPAGTLCPDDRWTAQYFQDGALEAADRLRFGVAPE